MWGRADLQQELSWIILRSSTQNRMMTPEAIQPCFLLILQRIKSVHVIVAVGVVIHQFINSCSTYQLGGRMMMGTDGQHILPLVIMHRVLHIVTWIVWVTLSSKHLF